MGHIRSHGCRSLLVYCGSAWCNHRAKLNADWLPDETALLDQDRRMVCTACGLIGANVRPDWSSRTGGAAWAARTAIETRLRGLNAYLIYMLYLRKKPPADTPNINTGLPWSALDLQDLRYCLAAGEPAEDIAEFLCRDVDEVRAKIDERPRSA